jgi:hypothetical protein
MFIEFSYVINKWYYKVDFLFIFLHKPAGSLVNLQPLFYVIYDLFKNFVIDVIKGFLNLNAVHLCHIYGI